MLSNPCFPYSKLTILERLKINILKLEKHLKKIMLFKSWFEEMSFADLKKLIIFIPSISFLEPIINSALKCIRGELVGFNKIVTHIFLLPLQKSTFF